MRRFRIIMEFFGYDSSDVLSHTLPEPVMSGRVSRTIRSFVLEGVLGEGVAWVCSIKMGKQRD